MLVQILYFFMCSWALGFSLTFFVKNKPKNRLERHIINLGFGIGTFPILGALLNLLNIPIHWLVFLVIGLVIPVYSLTKSFKTKKSFNDFFKNLKLTKSNLFIIIAFVLCLVLFVVYFKGAFSYAYLEDDDPWGHTLSSRYISLFSTFSKDISIDPPGYFEPYPQGFAIITGIVHQLGSDIIWTLKFFNILIIALGSFFFYFFAEHFLKSKKKALFATFGIVIIPCFLSHFIWASTLSLCLFFPALYALHKTSTTSEWAWVVVAIVVTASILVTQPSNAFIFGVFFFIFWVVKAVLHKKVFKKVFIAGLLALIIALAVFWVPMISKYGLEKTAAKNSVNIHKIGESINTAASGGAEKYYLNDFMVAKKMSKMDNPIGIGFFLFWLFIISVVLILYKLFASKKIFSHKHDFIWILLLWAVFAFIGVHGNRIPGPSLMPHRFWAILAIPVVLICAEGIFILSNMLSKLKIPKILVFGLIILGILITSGYPKYIVETSQWPPGVLWGSMDELQGYMSLTQVKKNSRIFPLCGDERKISAFNHIVDFWDPLYFKFQESAINKTPNELSSWLKSKKYDYMTLDATCIRKYGMNSTNNMLNNIGNSQLFSLVNRNNGFFLFKTI